MASIDLTRDEIRREGLEALRQRLGRAGMIRFLQQFGHGEGDCANERHTWVDKTSMSELRKAASRIRSRRGRKK